jgi:hypothetical protein
MTRGSIRRPGSQASQIDDYVVCIVGRRREHFGSDDATVRNASSELQELSVDMLREWPKNASAIPACGDGASFFLFEMYTTVRCEINPRSMSRSGAMPSTR